MLLLRGAKHRADICHGAIPAVAVRQVSELGGILRRLSVPPVIVRIHRVTCGYESLGGGLIAGRVLAHPVDDRYDGANGIALAVGQKAVDEQIDPIIGMLR